LDDTYLLWNNLLLYIYTPGKFGLAFFLERRRQMSKPNHEAGAVSSSTSFLPGNNKTSSVILAAFSHMTGRRFSNNDLIV
jgi:hypothetical protein